MKLSWSSGWGQCSLLTLNAAGTVHRCISAPVARMFSFRGHEWQVAMLLIIDFLGGPGLTFCLHLVA